MKIDKLSKMVNGWFIGDFEPTAFASKDFEVCYRTHKEAEKWATHYHKKSVEINVLIDGIMTIQDKTLLPGDIFTLHPWEIADPVFVTDCTVLTVKTPSVGNDKYEI